MDAGLNVRNEAGFRYADWIVDGLKTIETRSKANLDRLIGHRIKIIRTGQGRAQVIGEVTVTGSKQYRTKAEFESDYQQHLVRSGSQFDFDGDFDGSKVGYLLTNPQRYQKPYDAPYPRGIVYTKNIK
jgi:predicted transcriptional regulator